MEGFRFVGRDGVELAFYETGTGRPLILLHGFMGSSTQMRDGWARMFVEQGRRVVLPDFRGHGDSAKPHDPAAYPPDVLADDGLALVEHLGLSDGDYDLGGYSLGARIVLRMLVRGAKPGRAIVAGQGLTKVSGPQGEANRRLLTALLLRAVAWGGLVAGVFFLHSGEVLLVLLAPSFFLFCVFQIWGMKIVREVTASPAAAALFGAILLAGFCLVVFPTT